MARSTHVTFTFSTLSYLNHSLRDIKAAEHTWHERSLKRKKLLQAAMSRERCRQITEMLDKYWSGMTLGEIAKEFGTTAPQVSQMLQQAGYSPKEIRAERLRLIKQALMRTYSDEALLDFLRTAAKGREGPLTSRVFKEFSHAQIAQGGVHWPAVNTYQGRFGSWNRSLDLAGVPKNASRGLPAFQAQDCLSAILSVAEQIGHMPTSQEYGLHCNGVSTGRPSLKTIWRLLGGWSHALEEARDRSASSTAR